MNFHLITQILEERELQNPSLDFLKPDNSLYNTLILQLHENIVITDNSIRARNRERTTNKLSHFLNVAVGENVDLAITPEYSCPWDLVSNFLRDEIFPQENKMWIIGCESILPSDLNDLITANKDFEWIYEDELVRENLNSGEFLNPVICFFNVRNNDQEIVRICLLQFKTFPLGGSDWEQRNMIRGDDVYLIENDENSIKLITLICSDVLNPNFSPQDIPRFIHEPYLFVHIQLNTAPNHHDFRSYRPRIFQQTMNNKEVFCLNWSRGIEFSNIDGGTQYGGTALYIKSKEIDLTEEKLVNNHQLGLYYTFWQNRRSNVYFFNYDEFVFKVRTTKASQAAVLGVNSRRIGPEINKVFQWDNEWKNIEKVEDGFYSLCEEIERIESVDLETFKNNDVSPTDTERLISICVGEIDGKDWYSVKNMKSFKVEDSENVKRITFTHHPDQDIRLNRRAYLRRCAVLDNIIIKDEDNFPDNISDLKNNCTIKYRPNRYEKEYNLNLFPINDEAAPASIAYLGGEYDEIYASGLRDKMMDLFEDNQFEKRIVIWLQTLRGDYSSFSSDKKPSLKDNPSKSKRSIKKTE